MGCVVPVILFCTGVVSGSLLTLFLPVLPALYWCLLLIPLILLLLWRRWFFIAGITIYLLSLSWQYQSYHDVSSSMLQQPEQLLTGVIESVGTQQPDYTQFMFRIQQGKANGFRVRLSWSDSETTLIPGQQWQLPVKLKPVTAVANPGGVHREAAAITDGVIAYGRIRDTAQARLLTEHKLLRQRLIERVKERTAELETGTIQAALSVGERQFDTALWLGLQHSALGHLMAISGLHVGLVFGWVFWLSSIVLKRSGLSWLCQRSVVLALALSAAVMYGWASGFAIPAIRAIVALSVVVIARLLLRRLNYLSFWLVTTAALLLVWPMLVLSKSFWLSVLAVAMILLMLWRYPAGGKSRWLQFLSFCRFHFWLTLLMSVLGILLFGGTTLLGLLSNMLFVPWCSVIAIPALLITLVYEVLSLPGGLWLWQLTDWLFMPLWFWLEWCAGQSVWLTFPALSWLAVVLAGAGLLLLLVIRRKLTGVLVIVCLLPVLASTRNSANWQLHLVDIGQGLSVVLQHQHRAVIYDAGPRYGDYSATESHLLPFLRYQGIQQVDYLILSHDDADHTGNWPLLRLYYPQLQLITDIEGISRSLPCRVMPEEYHDARFALLVSQETPADKNDSSCVYQLTVNGWQFLLPGDISRRQEAALLKQYPQLKTDVLILAHHGSNTSSSLPFLHQVNPIIALNSNGRFNHYRHPAKAVQQRLALLSIPLLNTAEQGAITVSVSAEKLDIHSYRPQRLPLWL